MQVQGCLGRSSHGFFFFSFLFKQKAAGPGVPALVLLNKGMFSVYYYCFYQPSLFSDATMQAVTSIGQKMHCSLMINYEN